MESINKFKIQLEKIEKEIEKEVIGAEKTPELGDEVDPDIETQETQEIDNRLSVAQVLKSRLVEIKNALQKIEEGRYGICEKCGEEISEDVMDIVPESRLCKNCKKLSNV
ncbi:MAG: TraR/DksA C4-type zinc finger protein [Candidatus Wolfebacteria bacterium]|nr:TraR/DksA C4-type zinc finger protein [Candidatus Wolfebacteria bacterium]